MYTVSIAEAKAHLSEIINQVIAGEEIIITRCGHALVKLEAVKKSLKPLPSLEKFRSDFRCAPIQD